MNTIECPKCHTTAPIQAAIGSVGRMTTGPIEIRRGDLSLCHACGTALVFGEDLKPREMTADEFNALNPMQRGVIESVRYAFRWAHRASKAGNN